MTINYTLKDSMIESLRAMINTNLESIEHSIDEKFKRTYGNIRLNSEVVSVEINNIEKEAPFFDTTDEVAFFELREVNSQDEFVPYIPAEEKKVTDYNSKINSIKILRDVINIDNDAYIINYDRAIVIELENQKIVLSSRYYFDEDIFVSDNEDDVCPIDKVIDDWKCDEPNRKVIVDRTEIIL